MTTPEQSLPPSQFAPTISREQLASLPIRRYEGPVRIVNAAAHLPLARADILHEHVIGLDTETRPTFRKGQLHLPSLVQIATTKTVYLFQIQQLDCSALLADVLSHAAIVKAGIGLAEDFVKLKKVFPFEAHNVVDLAALARRAGIQQSGVRTLAGILLGLRITKGPQTSNWAARNLSPRQINYAATDAWICREMYLRFQKLGLLP